MWVNEVTKSTREQKEATFRKVHSFLEENPRMTYRRISKQLDIYEKTASNLVNTMIEEGIITNPQARIKSYGNVKEYVYFLDVKNKLRTYHKWIKEECVVYAGVLVGSPNFWVVSEQPLSIEGEMYVKGVRSDYYVAEPSKMEWNESIAKMREVVSNFPLWEQDESPLAFHLDEELLWDDEDAVLYQEFKYNLRIPYKPLMRKYCISCRKIKTWLKRLYETCTVFTRYFPGGINLHDPYLFFIQTDYEKALVDLFGCFPTSTLYFKVGDMLIIEPYLRSDYLRGNFYHRIQIPSLLETLIEKEYITDYNYVLEEYSYWRSV